MDAIQKRIQSLRDKLHAMFRRKPNDKWSYLEEYTLTEIAQRENCVDELAEIEAYRVKAGQFFPRCLVNLLARWTETLDASRNDAAPRPTHADKLIRLEELRRVEHRISTIRSQYDSHQGMSPEDRAQMVSLKARRDTLKTQLEMQI